MYMVFGFQTTYLRRRFSIVFYLSGNDEHLGEYLGVFHFLYPNVAIIFNGSVYRDVANFDENKDYR